MPVQTPVAKQPGATATLVSTFICT